MPLETMLAQKLWTVSRILGNRSPFDPYLLVHTEAQLDFIIEMNKRAPEGYNFERTSRDDGLTDEMRAKIAWAEKLIGKPAQQFWAKNLPSEAVLQRLRQQLAGPKLAQPPKRNLPPNVREFPHPPKRR